MTTREFAERLQEAYNRYSFKEDSGDLENAGIYSPTVEEIFGNGSFKSAMEAAELLQKDLLNQGERKIGINRNPYSIAVNIFAAAIGTERYDEPGVFGEDENKRIRNSAYALRNPETQEKEPVIWDILDPAQLSDDNREKYLQYQRKYRDSDTIAKYTADAVKNHKKAQRHAIDNLSADLRSALNKTQDPALKKSFKKVLEKWETADDLRNIDLVADYLTVEGYSPIFHLDWAEGKEQKKSAEAGLELFIQKRALIVARAIEACKAAARRGDPPIGLNQSMEEQQDLINAAEYLEAVQSLWKKSIMQKIVDPKSRKACSLRNLLKYSNKK